MYLTDILSAQSREDLTTCPNCGGSDYEDNRIDESLYLAVAQEAPRLRFEGNEEDARAVLIALCAAQIENFIRHQWLCNVCGVTFDA